MKDWIYKAGNPASLHPPLHSCIFFYFCNTFCRACSQNANPLASKNDNAIKWFGGCHVSLVWQSDGILEKHDGLLSCEGKMAAAITSCVYRWPQLSQCLHTGAQDSSPWQALRSPMPCSTMHTYQTRHINACRSIAFKMDKQAQPATLWQPCFGLQEDEKENLCKELSSKTLYVGLLEYPFFSQSLLWVKTFCLRPAAAASRQHFPSNNLGTSRKNQQPVSLAEQKRQLQRRSRGS